MNAMIFSVMPVRHHCILKTKGCIKYYKLITRKAAKQFSAVASNTASVRKSSLVSAAIVSKFAENQKAEYSTAKQLEAASLSTKIQEDINSPKEAQNVDLNKHYKQSYEIVDKQNVAVLNIKPILFSPKLQTTVELENLTVEQALKLENIKHLQLFPQSLIIPVVEKISTQEPLNIEFEPQVYKEKKDDKKLELVNAIKSENLGWHEQKINLHLLPNYYKRLSKIRLTGLVVITTIGGYVMAPMPLDPSILALTAIGTGLTSCAANSINQFLEIPYDSQMTRTKERVLVKGFLTPLHAIGFAAVTSVSGLSILYYGVNELVTALGAFNLILYTSVYTPMKRCSILNTWIGSVVGAIPPLMGWAACTGTLDVGALLMGGILYAWQFPHFNALSWNLRPDYSRAGYRMTSVVNPGLCRRTALRYSLAIVALCTMAPTIGVTTWTFAIDSLPLNSLLVYYAWRFYKDSDSASSRKLFRFSLIHLPLLMMLMFISKRHDSHKSNKNENNTLENNL